MHKIALSAVSIVAGIIGLFLGIAMGSLLGRVGSIQIIAFVLRIPIILIRSPKKLRSKWRMWQELRDTRKVERLKRQKRIKAFEEKIAEYKKEIKKTRAQIRRVRWECREPK